MSDLAVIMDTSPDTMINGTVLYNVHPTTIDYMEGAEKQSAHFLQRADVIRLGHELIPLRIDEFEAALP